MSRVGKLCVLLERLPAAKMSARNLARSYHLPTPFVAKLVEEAKQRRGLA